MANNERMIFGIGFDLATGVDAVIQEWNSKESRRIQESIDKKPLKISLEIKKNFITELRDFVKITREVANAQRALNNAKKQEIEIASKAATLKTREANARTANVRAQVQEATKQDQINKKKADAAYAEARLANAKRNGLSATQAQNTAYATQSGYLQRLIQRMGVYFGIHQMMSFITNIRQVTAEFELQRVALGALIQDAYKANTIFESIKIQAVKSPYEVKDLVNYTKRLAAYGVEADELMGTMNRLADISAGLGADMNRIILAYGQIQAAGVLKGTELRQLTELGLPMVDLLAEYYSTLRNEVVTTSDVFDMISKKEIPFQAVKDVLTDLTDEGGRFFDMQSKQAETLAGQWSNMKDTLSIMFDEMGRTEEVRGMIEGWIESVKWLALNWREVWSAIKIVGGTYAILKSMTLAQRLYNASLTTTMAGMGRYEAIKKRLNGEYVKALLASNRLTLANIKNALSWKGLTTAVKSATIAIKGAIKAMAVAMLSNPVGWIMGIVSVIGIFKVATSEGRDAMDAFRESQREAVKESVKNTTLMVANFKRLAKEVVESADGSERQNQALRRLKQQYGDIFPEYKLTIDYLRSMTDEANKFTKRINSMASSIRQFTAEDMRQNLIENYNKQIESQMTDTFVKLTDARGDNFAKLIGEIQTISFQEDKNVDDIVSHIIDEFLNTTGQSKEDFVKKLGLVDYENYGTPNVHIKEFDAMELSKLMDLLKESGTKGQADALLLLLELFKTLNEADGEIERMMGNFDDLDPQLKKVNDRISKLNTELKNIQENTGADTAEGVEKSIAQKEEDAINEALVDLFTLENVSIDPNFTLNLDTADDAIAQLKEKGTELSDAFYSGYEDLRAIAGDYDDVWREDLANMTTYLDDGTRKVQAYSADQIQGFNQLWDAIPEVAKRYKELKEELEQLKKTEEALKSKPISEQDTKEIENYRQEISKVETIMGSLYSFLEKYGGLDLLKDKDKGGSKTNPDIKKLEDEYAMVEKIYKKYEDFRKYMGDEQARAEVDKYFEGVDLKWLDKAFSNDELKAQAQEALRLLKTFWGDTTKAQQNIQFKIGDIDFNDTKKEIEDELKRLSDDISHTKAAKEFFDKMLGLTGDRELSATLTLSVYGTTGDDLKKLMTQQVLDAFKELPEGFDLTKAMLGGNNWDYNVLADLVKHLPETQQKNAQSIVDNWRKTNADILYDLQKSYEDYMTYEERKTRVVEKYSAERKKIMESEYDDDEKKKLVKAANKLENNELTDIAIEEFKASEDWAKSFEDLENLATPTIERLMSKLKEFIDLNKEDFTPEQFKTLMQEYQKLYDGLISRKPFQAITDSIKEYRTAMQGIQLAKEQLSAAQAIGDEDLIAFAERELTNAFDDAQKATTKLQKGLGGLADEFSQAEQFVQSFTETLGISEDSDFGAFLNGMAESFGGVAKAIAFAQLAMQLFDGTIKTFLTSNPIGWILLIVSAIISAVQAIMNARVNRINKEIESLQDHLDNLEYSFERLQKAQEKAFGSDYISNYEQRMANLVAQQDAYLKQAELERSKGKKADEDKIKEYENAARDTADEIKDMQAELSEYFLGTDLTSAARDFANAWIDAYKEFGNTTDAMKEKFQDMIQNMITNSLAAKIMEKALEPVFTMIDEMNEGDFYDPSFWQELMAKGDKAITDGSVGLENVFGWLESIGMQTRNFGGELTGISRDIATASEESILGLAAGINTQNFYISQVPPKLDVIIGLLQGGNPTQGSAITLQDLVTIQNQHLSYLPSIAQHTADTVAECKQIVAETRRTADALERVIKPRGVQSTHTLNTTLGS